MKARRKYRVAKYNPHWWYQAQKAMRPTWEEFKRKWGEYMILCYLPVPGRFVVVARYGTEKRCTGTHHFNGSELPFVDGDPVSCGCHICEPLVISFLDSD